mgnify:CR=1 FL=1
MKYIVLTMRCGYVEFARKRTDFSRRQGPTMTPKRIAELRYEMLDEIERLQTSEIQRLVDEADYESAPAIPISDAEIERLVSCATNQGSLIMTTDVNAKELMAAAMGSDIIDEPWLKRCGWVQIGNTWYPPEDSHPRKYDTPLLFWVRVDGTIRLAGGNEWISENDAKRSHLRLLCVALGINLMETEQ